MGVAPTSRPAAVPSDGRPERPAAAPRAALRHGLSPLGAMADSGSDYGIMTCASVIAWPTTDVHPRIVTRPIAAPNRFAARHVHALKKADA
jgi:hypothetical protein